MTRKSAAFLMTALAASVTAAFAQEAPPFTGSVTLGGMSTHVTSDNRFRFEEFRDLESGVTGGMDLRWRSDAWYHRLFGENLGRDDQFVELKGSNATTTSSCGRAQASGRSMLRLPIERDNSSTRSERPR